MFESIEDIFRNNNPDRHSRSGYCYICGKSTVDGYVFCQDHLIEWTINGRHTDIFKWVYNHSDFNGIFEDGSVKSQIICHCGTVAQESDYLCTKHRNEYAQRAYWKSGMGTFKVRFHGWDGEFARITTADDKELRIHRDSITVPLKGIK